MLSQISKVLLKNVIRHTDTHNRLVEEDDMWRQRDQEVVDKRRSRSYRSRADPRKEMLGAHMDRSPETEARCYDDREDVLENGARSNYWMQKLYHATENDPDRWGHSGFRELYPDEFETNSKSSGSDSDSPHSSHKKRKKKKKHKSKDNKKPKKSKKKSKDKRHKHKKGKNSDKQSHVSSPDPVPSSSSYRYRDTEEPSEVKDRRHQSRSTTPSMSKKRKYHARSTCRSESPLQLNGKRHKVKDSGSGWSRDQRRQHRKRKVSSHDDGEASRECTIRKKRKRSRERKEKAGRREKFRTRDTSSSSSESESSAESDAGEASASSSS